MTSTFDYADESEDASQPPLWWDIKVKIQSPSTPVATTHKLSLCDLQQENDNNNGIPNFHRLQDAILRVAGGEGDETTTKDDSYTQTPNVRLSLSYLDPNQGDLLTLSSQEEWEEALRQRRDAPLLVLAQVLQPTSSSTATTTTTTNSKSATLEERLGTIEELLHAALSSHSHAAPHSLLPIAGTPDTSMLDTSQDTTATTATTANNTPQQQQQHSTKDYTSLVKDHQAALNSRLQRVRQMNQTASSSSSSSTPTRGGQPSTSTGSRTTPDMLQDFLQRMIQERHDGMHQLMESRNKELDEWRQAQQTLQTSVEQTLKQQEAHFRSMWEQQLQCHTTKVNKVMEEKFKGQAQLLSDTIKDMNNTNNTNSNNDDNEAAETMTLSAVKALQQSLEERMDQLENAMDKNHQEQQEQSTTVKSQQNAQTTATTASQQEVLEKTLKAHEHKLKSMWDHQLHLHATKLHKGMEEQLKGQAKLLAMEVVTPAAMKEMQQELSAMIQEQIRTLVQEETTRNNNNSNNNNNNTNGNASKDTQQQELLQGLQKSFKVQEQKLQSIWEQQLQLQSTKLNKVMEEKFKTQAKSLGSEMVTPLALQEMQQELTRLIEERMDHLEFQDSSSQHHSTEQPVEAVIKFVQERIHQLETTLTETIMEQQQSTTTVVEKMVQGGDNSQSFSSDNDITADVDQHLQELKQTIEEKLQAVVDTHKEELQAVEGRLSQAMEASQTCLRTNQDQISQSLKEQLLQGMQTTHDSILKHEKQYASALRQTITKQHEETRNVIAMGADTTPSSAPPGSTDDTNLQLTLKKVLQEELKQEEQHENLRQVVLAAHEELLQTQKQSHEELQNFVVEYMDLVQRSLVTELDGHEWEKRLMTHGEQIQAQATAAILDRLDHLQLDTGSEQQQPRETNIQRRIRRWSLASGLSHSQDASPTPAAMNTSPMMMAPHRSVGITAEALEELLLSTAEKIEVNVETSCEQIQAQATAAILDKVEGSHELLKGKLDAVQALVQVLSSRSTSDNSASLEGDNRGSMRGRPRGGNGSNGRSVRANVFVEKFLDLESRSLQLGHAYDCIKNNRPVTQLSSSNRRIPASIANGEEKEPEAVDESIASDGEHSGDWI